MATVTIFSAWNTQKFFTEVLYFFTQKFFTEILYFTVKNEFFTEMRSSLLKGKEEEGAKVGPQLKMKTIKMLTTEELYNLM